MSRSPEIVVVTGNHPFRERAFDAMLQALRGVCARRLPLESLLTETVPSQAEGYLFYNFHQEEPDSSVRGWIESLLERGVGLVVLHHALLAWPTWPLWDCIVGASGRDEFSYYPAQRLTVRVADREHPIVRGVTDWEMTDETYRMPEPGQGVHLLLTTDHPNSSRAVGWAHQQGRARVFCFQSGHDNRAWDRSEFRQVVENALLWTTGRL
ncbi:MAG: hypothetical protein KatS3mg115_1600 [Candidatus Poribacteria bacterium]|nr:MAG: hypothetical protein KatS3mg115_1600 [Candidatus Poribacteria bacterium]